MDLVFTLVAATVGFTTLGVVNHRAKKRRSSAYQEVAATLGGYVDGRFLEVELDGLWVGVTVQVSGDHDATFISLYDPIPAPPRALREAWQLRLAERFGSTYTIKSRKHELTLIAPGAHHQAGSLFHVLEQIRGAALLDGLGDRALQSAAGLEYVAPGGPYHARTPPHARAATPALVTVGPVVRGRRLVTLAELGEPLPWDRPLSVAEAARRGRLPAASMAHAAGLDDLVLEPAAGRVVLVWPGIEHNPDRIVASTRLLQGLIAGDGGAYR